ncbi:histidine phosphatase family protein [Nonomuraea mesophila]|uniref:Histidine phosphatase family protein n=1 Tax=Nonomuraea mesophila TaxID=2530382 RepID=A0A4V2ZBX3_9ACTN|nr:histidine phosphatase family protein [Nonomuraea mesophila]
MLCMRHAESENVVARTAGALPDARLTPAGHEQAARAARRLAGEGVTNVYASTALRARHTAEIVGRALGLGTVVTLEGLTEMHAGRLEGAAGAAARLLVLETLRSWIVDGDLDAAAGDGEDGHAVTARTVAALTSIAAAHPGATVAVVGHVASLTTGLNALCGLRGRVWGAPLPHAVPFAVEWDGRSWRCETWPG